MNTQKSESRIITGQNNLNVHSIFSTIQGEGPFTGYRAIFVRLAGCNLQCPGCDTDYTEGRWDCNIYRLKTQVDIIAREKQLIVITGGEPFRQPIAKFCNMLVDQGYTVQIETNGTLPVPEELDPSVVIVCSPKTGKVHKTVEERAQAYKYVLTHGSIDKVDGLPILALGHSSHPKVARPPAGFKGPVFVQPHDEQDERRNALNLHMCQAACMDHGYVLQLQVHKLIGVE